MTERELELIKFGIFLSALCNGTAPVTPELVFSDRHGLAVRWHGRLPHGDEIKHLASCKISDYEGAPVPGGIKPTEYECSVACPRLWRFAQIAIPMLGKYNTEAWKRLSEMSK